MHVQVEHQVLAPGMEHHLRAAFGREPLSVGCKFLQRLPDLLEQRVVQKARIVQAA